MYINCASVHMSLFCFQLKCIHIHVYPVLAKKEVKKMYWNWSSMCTVSLHWKCLAYYEIVTTRTENSRMRISLNTTHFFFLLRKSYAFYFVRGHGQFTHFCVDIQIVTNRVIQKAMPVRIQFANSKRTINTYSRLL